MALNLVPALFKAYNYGKMDPEQLGIGTTVKERQALEDLLKDAEAMVAKIKARLAGHLLGEGVDVSASTSAAIELVQSQKTSDDTGNY